MAEPEKLLMLALIAIIMLFAYLILALFFERRKTKDVTPVTKTGLSQYDGLPSGVAVLMAWSEPGSNPEYHRLMQNEVRRQMPVLARALDRFIVD